MKKTTAKKLLENILYPVLAFGLTVGIWAIIAKVENNPFVLPMPSVVLEKFFTLGSESGFWESVGRTILRTIESFALSFVFALALAALGGAFKPLHKVVAPIVTFLRSAPTVAVILVLYAFLSNKTMAVVVGFLIAFPVMYSAFHTAIAEVDKDLLEMADLYEVRKRDKIFSIYLPTIAPVLFDTSESTLSLTLKVVVAAEILTSLAGTIGEKIQTAYALPEIESLLAWTLVAIVFSFVLEGVVKILKKIWEVAR